MGVVPPPPQYLGASLDRAGSPFCHRRTRLWRCAGRQWCGLESKETDTTDWRYGLTPLRRSCPWLIGDCSRVSAGGAESSFGP